MHRTLCCFKADIYQGKSLARYVCVKISALTTDCPNHIFLCLTNCQELINSNLRISKEPSDWSLYLSLKSGSFSDNPLIRGHCLFMTKCKLSIFSYFLSYFSPKKYIPKALHQCTMLINVSLSLHTCMGSFIYQLTPERGEGGWKTLSA